MRCKPLSEWQVLLTAFLSVGTSLLSGAGERRQQGEQSIRIIQTMQPEFPTNLDTMSLATGEARIVFSIDQDGRLSDVLVAGYSHPSFADEAVRALKAWRYEPARQYGEPVGVRASMNFRFESRGRVVSTLAIDSLTAMITSMAGPVMTNRVASLDELDAPVRAIQTVKPRHPGMGLRNDLSAGRAVIDFYIDEDGRPRMPVVLSSDDVAFSEAAVEALGAWRFAPPMRRGKSVIVRVQQAFQFAEIPSRDA